MNLTTLVRLTDKAEWQNMSEKVLTGLLPTLTRQPISGLWLLEAQRLLWHGRERR